MEMPWNRTSREELRNRIQDLESELEQLRDERDSWRERYEAETDRRSDLARREQELEEELKKCRQRLENYDTGEEGEQEDRPRVEFSRLSASEGSAAIRRLASMESGEDDMVTVRIVEGVREMEDVSGLRNALSSSSYSAASQWENTVFLTDDTAIFAALKMRPFFDPGWSVSGKFALDGILEFWRREKTWVRLSAGDSLVLKEQEGEVLERREVKTRVDSDHSQGGYSQSRFERKRESQVEEHLDAVEDQLEIEDPLLVGERDLCSRMEGRYLGGFDPNRRLRDELYKFRAAAPFQ